MSENFIGEIRMFGGNYAPMGWAYCNGQSLPIGQYQALFSLIGTYFGGDGSTTFNLPDLRCQIPIHQGAGPGLTPKTLGRAMGKEKVVLTAQQLAAHDHGMVASPAAGTSNTPENQVPAKNIDTIQMYANGETPTNALNMQSIANVGGSQAHDNMMPSLCVNYIIATEGIYPTRD